MFLTVLLFIVGLLCLMKGGDWFVDGSIGIAKKFHLSDLLIGATIVSIGTTLPEVMVSASAAISGHGEIAYGNAIGSIICNTSLIAATTIVFAPGKVSKKSLKTPVLFFFISAIIYSIVAYFIGYFDRFIGILLLLIFIIYIITTVRQMRESEKINPPISSDGAEKSLFYNLFLIILGAIVIAFGANLLIDNGIIIAKALGVPESVIALTFIALGTSLPELVTAIVSIIKGHGSLSLGNIIGANLFNLVLVSGVAITISPFSIPKSKILFSQNASLVLDIPVMFLVMLLLTLPPLLSGRLSRFQGIILWIIYCVFCFIQFVL